MARGINVFLFLTVVFIWFDLILGGKLELGEGGGGGGGGIAMCPNLCMQPC